MCELRMGWDKVEGVGNVRLRSASCYDKKTKKGSGAVLKRRSMEVTYWTRES
jgi:hypothetical protein